MAEELLVVYTLQVSLVRPLPPINAHEERLRRENPPPAPPDEDLRQALRRLCPGRQMGSLVFDTREAALADARRRGWAQTPCKIQGRNLSIVEILPGVRALAPLPR